MTEHKEKQKDTTVKLRINEGLKEQLSQESADRDVSFSQVARESFIDHVSLKEFIRQQQLERMRAQAEEDRQEKEAENARVQSLLNREQTEREYYLTPCDCRHLLRSHRAEAEGPPLFSNCRAQPDQTDSSTKCRCQSFNTEKKEVLIFIENRNVTWRTWAHSVYS